MRSNGAKPEAEPRPNRTKSTSASRTRTDSPRSGTPAPGLSLVRSGPAEPIRWSKVMTAQARIAVGYYDRPDVLESLADAVLSELDEH